MFCKVHIFPLPVLVQVDENGMPIPRYSSSSTLSHGRDGTGRGGEGDGTMHPSNRNSGLYRSSPDLSRSAQLNRRSSSTDSNDGSYYGGGHSRQSSDSVDYPTRRYSAQHPARKTSVSADPLQFIKVKGATNLALTAEEQMKLAAETKRIKPSPSFDDDNTDWRSVSLCHCCFGFAAQPVFWFCRLKLCSKRHDGGTWWQSHKAAVWPHVWLELAILAFQVQSRSWRYGDETLYR